MIALALMILIIGAVIVFGAIPLRRQFGAIAAAAAVVEQAHARAAILERRLAHQRALLGPRPHATLVREIARSETAVSEALIAYNDAVADYARVSRPLRGLPSVAPAPAIYVPPEAA